MSADGPEVSSSSVSRIRAGLSDCGSEASGDVTGAAPRATADPEEANLDAHIHDGAAAPELLEHALAATVDLAEALDAGDVEQARCLAYAVEDGLADLGRLLAGDRVQPDPGGGLVAGRDWMEYALRLDAENHELRAWLTGVLFWVAGRQELAELVRAELERRFLRTEAA